MFDLTNKGIYAIECDAVLMPRFGCGVFGSGLLKWKLAGAEDQLLGIRGRPVRDLDRERFGQVMIDDHMQSDRSGALRLEFFGHRIDQKVLVPDSWMERLGLVSSDDPVDWVLDF